jgi:uncharacterized membrane protein YagU involved in acid resistance
MARRLSDAPVLGALAGLIATFAMTAAMAAMQRRGRDQTALPPSLLLRSTVLAKAAERHPALVTFAHFAFGAAAGGLFAGLTARRDPVAGIGWGLLVWAGSYAGWVPATGMTPPAVRQSTERNLLMILAHVVWGTVLAASLKRLETDQEVIFRPRSADARHGLAPHG